MKNSRFVLARLALVTLLVMTSVLVLAPRASANVKVPGGNVPFYARIGRGEIYHTGDWAAIVFYRPSTCIPATFNLLDFFDIPAAFGCNDPTTAGFEIWTSSPETDPAPRLTQLYGLGAVPVWFVSWTALQGAIGDDLLTIGELETLAPRKGTASFFQEVLRPTPAVKVTTIELNAVGVLADGHGFQLHIQGVGEGLESCSTHCVVRIAFD